MYRSSEDVGDTENAPQSHGHAFAHGVNVLVVSSFRMLTNEIVEEFFHCRAG